MTDNHDEEHSSFLSKIFSKKTEPTSQDELEQVIREASENEVIDEDTEEMLQGIFDINRLRVSDVMIPANEIVTIHVNSTIEEAAKIVLQTAHSRYPVIGEDKDHIVGVLLAKDLIPYACGLKELEGGSIKSILRSPIIVPEAKRVNSMLKEFQQNRFHIAIVVDEFGGTSGLVSLEDIVEEIFGDIEDEHDNTKYVAKQLNEHEYVLSARLEIEKVNELFDLELPESDEYMTVSGLILHEYQSFPKLNEVVKFGRYEFKILKNTQTKIELVRLKVCE